VPVSGTAPIYVGGGIGFNEGVTQFFGTVGGGNNAGFVVADLGGVNYDDVGITSFSSRLSAGGQIAGDSERRVVICPTASVTNEFVNDLFGTNVEAWVLDIAAGASVGVALGGSEVQVVPGFGAFGARSRLRLKAPSDESVVLNETYGYAVVGVGIVMHQRFSLTPQVFLPFGLEGGTNGFTLTFAVSFPKG
jgi:hypothetical protein